MRLMQRGRSDVILANSSKNIASSQSYSIRLFAYHRNRSHRGRSSLRVQGPSNAWVIAATRKRFLDNEN